MDMVEICGCSSPIGHTDLERILLGDYARFDLEYNVDSESQTNRYDVLTGIKHFATQERIDPILKFRRDHWRLPDGEISWQPKDLPQVNSGVIFVTSGRSTWFGSLGIFSPIFLWCLVRGYQVDVLTDVEEVTAYSQALSNPDNLRNLVSELGKLAKLLDVTLPANDIWQERIANCIHVVSPARKGVSDMRALPRGFGFNRYISMEWMMRRFTGICAIVDDNTLTIGANSVNVLDWLFEVGNVSRRVATVMWEQQPHANNWLCVVFNPCTTANRPRVENLVDSRLPQGVADYDGTNIRLSLRYSPLIIQQLTLWNASAYRQLNNGSPPNYDPFLLTGKEDVELFRRLLWDDEIQNLMFCDDSLQLVKCAADSTPNSSKEAAMVNGIRDQLRFLCPCLGRMLDLPDHGKLIALANRFSASGHAEAADLRTPDGYARFLNELFKKQNMVLEQLLVPEL